MDVEDLMCQMSLGMSYPTKLFPIVMPQLESLNLRVQRHELNSFDLSCLKNLRLLRVCPVPDNQSRTFENVPDQVAQILAQLANSRLRTLQLYIGQNGWLLLPSRARQWQAMDSLLSSGACRELETVEILYNGPIDGARHTICEPMLYLPYAHARGISLSLRQDHSTPDG
ncbi:hypothetical protein WOLCODRAFT_137522 [Wolfiporia cocos MD-104 SS10]|uniref:Uncharacterized protein n=1 Tax=Wolfiporia cocos (strain MD-104) TaxID=742152 RepID=A0A2H3JHH7_WOLCO|nr:hypothetical protein WOLCODRAFT_137522 [Wolfiporia cocos MD-104 SS10]